MGNEFSYENLVRVINITTNPLDHIPYRLDASGNVHVYWLDSCEGEDGPVMESASESDILSFLCGR